MPIWSSVHKLLEPPNSCVSFFTIVLLLANAVSFFARTSQKPPDIKLMGENLSKFLF